MADTAILERYQGSSSATVGPDAMLAREVESVLEAAERTRPEGLAKTRPWYFRMPQAGVRYYSF